MAVLNNILGLTKKIKILQIVTLLMPFFLNAQVVDKRNTHISCAVDSNTKLTACDYRHQLGIDVKNISLKVGEKAIQLEEKDITRYPAEGQITAILFLVDISDPKRKETIEKKNVKAITEILAKQKIHHHIGIATFDSDFKLIAPISSNMTATKAALSEIKATGFATEYYKSILSGIEELKKVNANRKALIIMSDGKDEDKAYGRDEVLKAAKDADISVLGIGYLEKPTEAPYLQNIQKIATETFGQYIDGTDGKLPESFLTQPFAFIEKGGRVSFNSSSYFGNQDVTIILGTKSDKTVDLKTLVSFPDYRSSPDKVKDFFLNYYIYIVIGLIVFGVLIGIIFYLYKRSQAKKPEIIEYGVLEELDGSGTRHILNKTAIRIGRGRDNDVILQNDSISTHHAEIHRRREGDFYIVDLSSTNGVYVNDKEITQTEIKHGDMIELGEVRLHFYTN